MSCNMARRRRRKKTMTRKKMMTRRRRRRKKKMTMTMRSKKMMAKRRRSLMLDKSNQSPPDYQDTDLFCQKVRHMRAPPQTAVPGTDCRQGWLGS